MLKHLSLLIIIIGFHDTFASNPVALGKVDVSKLFGTSAPLNKKTSRTSPFKDTCKKCRESFKCKRAPLPWEIQKKEKKPKGVLPFHKVAEEYAGSSNFDGPAPCRFCPPSPVPKPKPKKRKRSKKGSIPCKPFFNPSSEEEKKSVCERRKMAKCLKNSCNPEIECKNLKPSTKKTNKTYPLALAIIKRVPGCPVKGWKDLHKKAKAECKKNE